jgi:ATP-dependent RNA helicase MSS116, mitochondrial
MYMVASLEQHFSVLYDVLKKHVSGDPDYKVSDLTILPTYIIGIFQCVNPSIILQVIIFCTTAMVTKLVAEVLSQLKLNIREIHSRKSQSARTKVSDEFRKSKGLILVSSDVSARGVDYPDVTLVIQVCYSITHLIISSCWILIGIMLNCQSLALTPECFVN